MNEIEFSFKESNYTAKHKHKNGQTFRICFEGWKDTWKVEPINYYNVLFEIYTKKKKSYLSGVDAGMNITGKCGIDGLLWAKRAIIEFEEFLKPYGDKNCIVVYWADNRRRNVYEKALKKIGFEIKNIDGGKRLVKYF